MKKNLIEQAIEFSRMGYTIEVLRDKTTDGDYIYLAQNPELDGCMAQGETPEEAQNNLDEVRIEYFEHLLEFHLPIPTPNRVETKDIAGSNVSNQEIIFPGFEGSLNRVIQPNKRETLFSVTPN